MLFRRFLLAPMPSHRGITRSHQGLAALLVGHAALMPSLSWAQVNGTSSTHSTVGAEPAMAVHGAARESATDLPEVTVRSTRPAQVQIEADRPTTTIQSQEIQRRQATSLFDVLKDVPGVSVDGGPRATGMRFNIRGFSDNEDVLFKIDGAVKGFEKYRFGSGVFIEPELLKSVEVQRGPSVTSGSGALGGTINATTQSASDLLRPGQQVGAMVKLGTASNNDERLRMLALYGRLAALSSNWDWLVALTQRNAQDIRLADGSRLKASATASDSSLLKLGWRPNDDLKLELSRVAYTSGPERAPYDATAGEPGVFGIVRRTIDDETINLKLDYTPPDSLWKLRGRLSRERTHMRDLLLQADNGITYVPGSLGGPGDRTDLWHYDIQSAELFNDAEWQAGPFSGVLTLGWQALRQDRTMVRLAENPIWNAPTGGYPNGFYAAQPPGGKDSMAWIAEHALTWGNWTLTPGVRWDRYRVSAAGGTLDLLRAQGQASSLSFERTTPSMRLSWQPQQWVQGLSFTLSQAESFRPPLIDEAFTNGAYSRCLRSMGSVHFPLYDTKTGTDLAPPSGICGNLYRPEVSTTREASVAWKPARDWLGTRWQARAAYFTIDTRDLLESLSAIDGRVQQPGTERRHGSEIEVQADAPRWFGSLGHSRVQGRVNGGTLSLTQTYSGPLYDVPGTTTTVSFGVRADGNRAEAGLRVRDIGERQAIVPNQTTFCSRPGVIVPGLGNIGTQQGVRLIDLFASYRFSMWTPNDFVLRLSVDNLGNEAYCLNDGFGGGVGTQAPGRNVKLQLTWRM